MAIKCKRLDCSNEVPIPERVKGNVYCSKDCAPYGNLYDPVKEKPKSQLGQEIEKKTTTRKERRERAELRKKLESIFDYRWQDYQSTKRAKVVIPKAMKLCIAIKEASGDLSDETCQTIKRIVWESLNLNQSK